MINLQKPLEGVPGLLLLAALVLFGATIGISLALAFSLVEMKDSLANFLGGVVGAGLGAALAVMGAMYVQHREQRARLAVPLHELEAAATSLGSKVMDLGLFLSAYQKANRTRLPDSRLRIEEALDRLATFMETFPSAAALPWDVRTDHELLVMSVKHMRESIAAYTANRRSEDAYAEAHDSTLVVNDCIRSLYATLRRAGD